MTNLLDKLKIRIEKRICTGHISEVYLVTRNRSRYIFKIYPVERSGRGLVEIDLLEFLRHQKIRVPKVIDYGYIGDRLFVLSEFVEGNMVCELVEDRSNFHEVSDLIFRGRSMLNKINFDGAGFVDSKKKMFHGSSRSWNEFMLRSCINDDAVFFQKNNLVDRSLYERLHKEIQESIKVFENDNSCLNQGDFNFSNLIVRNNEVYFLDLDLPVVGSSIYDLSWASNYEFIHRTSEGCKSFLNYFVKKYHGDKLSQRKLKIVQKVILLRSLKYWFSQDYIIFNKLVHLLKNG